AVRQLRHLLAEAGVPFDRKKFNPHITLIRKPEVPKGMPDAPPSVTVPGAKMRVDHISLMRSDRGKTGMIYTEI
ncbi:MAG: RNA 2',3'-cyclic phosphodiesterase, partial [Firmicutes bacterium]|nr:RNA 2',3'-cyclic phosphodiesterase [Bacillota bacterium]